MELNEINLKEKELISRAFRAFNDSIDKLRKYQRKLEGQITELTTELTNVIESLSSGLIVTDLKGDIKNLNRAASAITEVSKADALEKDLNSLLNIEVLPNPLDEKGLQKVGGNYHQQFTIIRESGEKIILDTSTSLIQSDESECLGIIVNLNDVTKMKQLEEEAERKNRLTAMGEIAANVAHEIRNPLGGIELFVSMLKMDLAEDPDKIELLNHIGSGVRSMNHIISNLLEYTKPRPIAREEVNVHDIVNTFIDFASHLATAQGIEVVTKLEAEDPDVHGDPELLKQVLHNLFVNAVQAMPVGGGALTIEVKNQVETSAESISRFDRRMPTPTLKLLNISVRDTGKGMSEEVKRRLFDPFFTTKERGTGLGMSITRSIVDSHGGAILVDSVLDAGSVVTLQIPLPEERQEELAD